MVAVSLLLGGLSTQAQFSISPLTSFGGGDGWLSPGEGGYTYLTTGNTERGLAYANGHLYLSSRAASGIAVRILNPQTGAEVGALDSRGITGGTFALNMLAAGGDGAIYAANLTGQATTSPFKVYKWATESSAPVLAYSGTPIAGGRVGDTLAAIGSGSSTRLVAGFGSTPSVTGNNGYAIIDPTAGTATQISFSGTPPAAGDFRLGLTFAEASHVLGSQGSTLYRSTSYTAATGTLLDSPSLTTSAERLLSYAVVNGEPLLAVESTGDATVRIYDVTDPAAPVLLGSGNATSGTLSVNDHRTGELAWGDVTQNADGTATAKLYAMSSNQGIQAFLVAVPEPTVFSLGALGFAAFAFWRKQRK